jgi:hypothetical protein
MATKTIKNIGTFWVICDQHAQIVRLCDTAADARMATKPDQFLLPPGHTLHACSTGVFITDPRNEAYRETYRDYLITVEYIPELSADEDPFEVRPPARFVPRIDGLNVVYAGIVLSVDAAVSPARQWVDKALLHPLTGETLTKAEKEAEVDGW